MPRLDKATYHGGNLSKITIFERKVHSSYDFVLRFSEFFARLLPDHALARAFFDASPRCVPDAGMTSDDEENQALAAAPMANGG